MVATIAIVSKSNVLLYILVDILARADRMQKALKRGKQGSSKEDIDDYVMVSMAFVSVQVWHHSKFIDNCL